MKETLEISATAIEAIKAALEKGNRVELIPVKDGVKILRIKREEIKYAAGITGRAKN